MAESTHDVLLDHEYDGIREYDNPCPKWWHTIFLGTFVFSVFYFAFFHLGTFGWTAAEAHQAAQARVQAALFSKIGELQPDAPTLVKYMHDDEWMAWASSVFSQHCASCHGANGEGGVGVNLTDDYYKNIKQITDIPNVLKNGANNKSMPAWGVRLSQNEITLLSAYVASLRGKNLVGPRGAEGEQIPPWPTESSAQSEAKPANNASAPAETPADTRAETPADNADSGN